MAGMKKSDQRKVVSRIHEQGMTVTGWARSRGFSPETVKNVLYRDWGVGEVGPVAQDIIDKLREEGLA